MIARMKVRVPWVVMFVALVTGLTLFIYSLNVLRADLNQARADRAALAEQVKQMGGRPVVDAKPGDRGPSGERGPQGERGPKGERGPQGLQGPPGQRGSAGATPPCLMTSTHCQGATGIPGKAGTPGLVGPAGTDGTDGVDGADGATGETGPQGPAGEAGPAGAQGDPGPKGDAGRGISSGPTCVDDDTTAGSHWETTYTDGTTGTSSGPCRINSVSTPPIRVP